MLAADAAPPALEGESATQLLGDGQHLAEEIRQVMAHMVERGYQDTPEFQEIVATYKDMTSGINEIQRGIEAEADAQREALAGGKFGSELLQQQEAAVGEVELPAVVREKLAARPLPAGADLAGVESLTELLGPSGRPGFVCMGPQVTNLQKILAAARFPSPVNGRFDARTGDALRLFQQTYGLEPDGLASAATRQALNALLAGG